MIVHLLQILIVPGLLVTAVLGLLACWVDRKVTARLQYRRGPRMLQPFIDIIKLLGKETSVPEGVSYAVFMSAPLIGLGAVTVVSTMLWQMNIDPFRGFLGDLIVIIYLLVLPSISLIAGGLASRNPYSSLGAGREMKLMLAYELPFILAILTVITKTNTLLLGGMINYQADHGMLIASASGFLAFIACLMVIQAKMGFTPFDIAEAEQELMGGPLLEYSGPMLAAFKLTKAMLLFILPVFLITLFMGGLDISSTAGIFFSIIKYVIILVLMILIKNTNPRLRIDQAVRFFWGPVASIALISLILAMLRF